MKIAHLLFCLQQRYLLASIDQKNKNRALCLHSIFFFSFLSFEFLSFLIPKNKNRVVMIVDCFESRHKKKGIRDKNNGLRKQFQTSQTIFFRSPAANWRKKSLKRKKVRKSHVLFCLQQRCLLASIDQKTKIKWCVFTVFFFFSKFFFSSRARGKVQKINLSSCRSTTVLFSFMVFVDPGAIG